MPESGEPRTVGVFLFPQFELLDVCGPVQMLGVVPQWFHIVLLGPEAGAVESATGQQLVAERSWDDEGSIDIVIVPGGRGTRVSVTDQRLLAALRRHAAFAEIVTSVCTGSALLAAAGLLDGFRATSNKLAFDWVRSRVRTSSGSQRPAGWRTATGLRRAAWRRVWIWRCS